MSSLQTTLTCNYCRKTFKSVSNKNRHLRNIHKDSFYLETKSSRIVCPSCPEKATVCFRSFECLRKHLTEAHDIKFDIQHLKFDNKQQFCNWKERIEKETKSFYSLNSTCISTLGKTFYYECHRSNLGKFESKCNERAPKASGSIKINGVCPSRIRAEVCKNTSKFSVMYVSTHFGHKNELRCQPLTENEKSEIIEQIQKGVSYSTILKKARNKDGENCNRLNLLTRRNLYYLAERNNLNEKRNKSDLVAVEKKVTEWNRGKRKNVFIFKKPGEAHEKLETDDFVLAFMNEEMEHMLKTYGTRIICMDGTHETNPYKFELTTLLVLDDQNIGYPVLFLISNRKDTILLEILLEELKTKIGILIPDYFMTNATTVYWDAWNSVMGALPQRLSCTWHVKKNWTSQGGCKIQNKENKKKILQNLNALLKETDERKFLRLQQELIKYLKKENEDEFLQYLNTNYFQDDNCISCWAHCYRKQANINTNMHFEALHETLKQNYFCGKTLRRLKTCLDSLDRLVKNKSWKRIASQLRPVATQQDLLVNKYHKKAMEMSFEAISEVNSNQYLVHCQFTTQFHEVNLCNSLCTCLTDRCTICDVCVHRFKCSCCEVPIKNNFCKHIHLVAMYIKMTKTKDSDSEDLCNEEQNTELLIDIPSTIDNDLLQETNLKIAAYYSVANTSFDSDEKNEQCIQLFNLILGQCVTDSDYDNVTRTLMELKSQIFNTNLPQVTTSETDSEQLTFFPPSKKAKRS